MCLPCPIGGPLKSPGGRGGPEAEGVLDKERCTALTTWANWTGESRGGGAEAERKWPGGGCLGLASRGTSTRGRRGVSRLPKCRRCRR